MQEAIVDVVGPLRAEAECLAAEIAALHEAARRKAWEAVVQMREIHGRICDATVRLEHVRLDIRERTGEDQVPSVPLPFGDFLASQIRRFVVAAP